MKEEEDENLTFHYFLAETKEIWLGLKSAPRMLIIQCWSDLFFLEEAGWVINLSTENLCSNQPEVNIWSRNIFFFSLNKARLFSIFAKIVHKNHSLIERLNIKILQKIFKNLSIHQQKAPLIAMQDSIKASLKTERVISYPHCRRRSKTSSAISSRCVMELIWIFGETSNGVGTRSM